MTKQRDVGLRDDERVKAFAEAADELNGRERGLVQRESAMATELSSAQADLGDLNRRLDEVEREMIQPTPTDDVKPAKRQQ